MADALDGLVALAVKGAQDRCSAEEAAETIELREMRQLERWALCIIKVEEAPGPPAGEAQADVPGGDLFDRLFTRPLRR